MGWLLTNSHRPNFNRFMRRLPLDCSNRHLAESSMFRLCVMLLYKNCSFSFFCSSIPWQQLGEVEERRRRLSSSVPQYCNTGDEHPTMVDGGKTCNTGLARNPQSPLLSGSLVLTAPATVNTTRCRCLAKNIYSFKTMTAYRALADVLDLHIEILHTLRPDHGPQVANHWRRGLQLGLNRVNEHFKFTEVPKENVYEWKNGKNVLDVSDVFADILAAEVEDKCDSVLLCKPGQ